MEIRMLNRDKLLNRRPALVGTVNGVRLYEYPVYPVYPVYGDEASLVMVCCGLTDFWEMSDVFDCVDNAGLTPDNK